MRLVIYDTQGRRVRTLVDAPLAPGHHDVAWDGRNDAGRRVASAVYFYDLQAAGQSVRRKVVMVK